MASSVAPNSFCIHDPNNQRMGCECLSGHVFLDVQSPGFSPQSCDGKRRSTEFQLVELRNTYWQNLIYNRRHESVTEGLSGTAVAAR